MRRDSIVVTGSYEPLALEEADRSVTLLPARQQSLVVNTLTDVLQLDPSLDVRRRAADGVQSDLSIRGSSFGQTLVLLNGQRLNDAQSGHHNMDIPVPLESVERIEVLRGSGSTLYGSDAVGGAIKEGDRVDVVATVKSDEFQAATLNLGAAISPTEAARLAALTGLDLKTVFSSMSLTILQQAEVLAVDALSASTTPTTQGESSTGVFNSGSSGTASKEELQEDPVITLMVTPAEAERIVYAQQIGRLWFLLVPAQDTTKVTTEGVVLPNLVR